MTTPKTYRGWSIEPSIYSGWDATGPDYDASYEGEEDGWVDNGQRAHGTTWENLRDEIDIWFEENPPVDRDQERIDRVWEFVEGVHANQLYDGLPYREGHLEKVKTTLFEAGLHTTSDEIIAASHDAIEDARDDMHQRFVFDWLKANLTEFEFRMVWALTGLGENRKARNADAKAKIASDPEAANYKVADRVTNWRQSPVGSRHAKMYLKESDDFYTDVVKLATNKSLVDHYMDLVKIHG